MPELRPGDVLGGRYEIIDQLGAGGMARVYRAHDPRLGRDVAIKVLSSRYAADPTFVERFRREASAAAQLNHPNIVQVFDRGEAGGTYFIVMEHLTGPDLKTIIRRRGPLPPLEAIDDALQILAALAVAHRHDVIHRDVKPQNVIQARDGSLKVTDFGIARAGAHADVTEAGSVIGTAQYLSPEQARGGEVTPASDCYAAGIVLYEMLTGRVPFDGERPVTIAMKQINEPPVAPTAYEPGIPEALERVVLKALNKRPSERYRSAEEFSAALMSVRAGMEGATGQTVPITAITNGGTDFTQVMEARTESTRVVPPRPDDTPARRAIPPITTSPRRSATPWVVGLIVLAGLLAIAAYVLLSGGGTAKKVTIPTDIVGLQSAEAVTRLTNLGLDPQTQQVVSAEDARGTVVGTDPAPGTEVSRGDVVTVRVGAGPVTKQVPDLVDQLKDDAVAALKRDGFTPKVVLAFDETVAKDHVISQNPEAGAQLAEGGTVTLTVSKGAQTVRVPDVRRVTLATATERLRAEGLDIGNVTEEYNADNEAGTVIRQDPGPTTTVPRGTKVNVVLAKKPEQLAVPGVIGMDATLAGRKLRGQGFEVKSEGANDSAPAGQVIDQTPGEGELVDPGTVITITVSEGPLTETSPVPTIPGTTPSAQQPAPGTVTP